VKKPLSKRNKTFGRRNKEDHFCVEKEKRTQMKEKQKDKVWVNETEREEDEVCLES